MPKSARAKAAREAAEKAERDRQAEAEFDADRQWSPIYRMRPITDEAR